MLWHRGRHTLAFTHWHSHTAMGWHGGCLFITMVRTLQWAGMEAVCLSPWLGLAWRLSVYRHGSHTGMEAVCLSPWLGLAWRLSVYRHGLGWHGGCLFIAMAHTLAFTHWRRLSVYRHGSHTGMEAVCLLLAWRLAWRLSVYHHGSHTGIHTLAFNEVPFRIGIHTLAMKEIQLAIAMAFEGNTGI